MVIISQIFLFSGRPMGLGIFSSRATDCLERCLGLAAIRSLRLTTMGMERLISRSIGLRLVFGMCLIVRAVRSLILCLGLMKTCRLRLIMMATARRMFL